MSQSNTVRQTIVTNLEAPRLRGVSTKDFVQFKKARDLYEKQVAEKNREPGVSITPTSYLASIEDAFLRTFVAAKWVPVASISDIQEEHLVACVEAKAVYDPKEHDLERIEDMVADIKMDLGIKDAESRVWTLFQKYVTRLENHGMADLPDRKPHVAIKHILAKVIPKELRERMKTISFWRKDTDFDKKDLPGFMRELVKQAKRFDEQRSHGKRTRGSDWSEDEETQSEAPTKKKKKNSHSSGLVFTKKKTGASGGTRGEGANARSGGNWKPPKCLNKACSDFHWVSDCPITSKEEQIRLRKEYRESKRRSTDAKKTGTVNRVGVDEIKEHSALFSGSFSHGAVDVVALADQGSDTNLISKSVFGLIREAEPNLEAEILEPPIQFSSINQADAVVCRRRITADVELRIRHGTKLRLRNVEWLVSDGELAHVVIGRPVLEAIGCDNRALLAAASDRAGGVVDAREAMRERVREKGHGTVAAVLKETGEGLFHHQGGAEEDCIPDDEIFLELTEDTPQELDDMLEKAVERAIANRISAEGASELRRLLAKHRSIFA